MDDNTSDTSTLPFGEINLVSGTSVYGLPSGTLTVQGVEVKNSGGNWAVIKSTTYEEIRRVTAVDEYFKTDSIPSYYVVSGDVIELFPAPNFTQSSSLRVYFDRDVACDRKHSRFVCVNTQHSG